MNVPNLVYKDTMSRRIIPCRVETRIVPRRDDSGTENP